MIRSCPLPPNALLQAYVRNGSYTDCYAVTVAGAITHEQFVAAFYTSPVFKLERAILKWTVRRPSTDAQANAIAAGAIDEFAAWRVEARAANQLLMREIVRAGRGRGSWWNPWMERRACTSDRRLRAPMAKARLG